MYSPPNAFGRSAFADTIHDLEATRPGRPRGSRRIATTVKVPRRGRWASLLAVLACGVVALAAACAAVITSPLGPLLLEWTGR